MRPLTASLGGLAVRTRTRLRMISFPNTEQSDVENGCAHKHLDAAARHHPVIDFEHEDRASQPACAGHRSKKSHARDSCVAIKCRRQEFKPRALPSPARLKGRLVANARPLTRGACWCHLRHHIFLTRHRSRLRPKVVSCVKCTRNANCNPVTKKWLGSRRMKLPINERPEQSGDVHFRVNHGNSRNAMQPSQNVKVNAMRRPQPVPPVPPSLMG